MSDKLDIHIVESDENILTETIKQLLDRETNKPETTSDVEAFIDRIKSTEEMQVAMKEIMRSSIGTSH
jgi:hypothetical protein